MWSGMLTVSTTWSLDISSEWDLEGYLDQHLIHYLYMLMEKEEWKLALITWCQDGRLC